MSEYENGELRYRVRTNRIAVIVAFDSETGAGRRDGVEVLMAKKCRSCGGVVEERLATRHYDESGLKGIVLVGIPVRKCSDCGEEAFGIPRLSELHRLIALTLVRKPSGLGGTELRFLRKHLGYSGVDLAERLDVTPEHLSRWENDAAPMSAMAERLIRLMVVHNDRVEEYSLDDLKEAPKGKPIPLKLKVRLDEGGWQTAA
jgi:putative zinc finger/helix-turn-helix YgiT family protein